MKSEAVKNKILNCAKSEFMRAGYAEASMRTIAQNAGVTTGSLYNRFKNKEDLFHAVVGEAADKLLCYFAGVINDFSKLSPKSQKEALHTYSDSKMDEMIDIVYDNFDSFKLIVCKSAGSPYQHYIDKLIDIETESSFMFAAALKSAGIKVNELRRDLTHMLSSALFNGIFEVVSHDMKRSDANDYIKQITLFFSAGWDQLLGL